jgi:3-methylcrotonyl-CoA carboxylase alpha subunit
MERYVAKARHIEIQVFGFGEGRAIHLYERECSIQRRFQKIIEETPAPGIPQSIKDDMAAAAVRLTQQQNYLGAGTIEFILDADSFEFFFLEMNTRIQVEHPVTEMTTNTDLVSMQIQLAFGDDLSHITQASITQQGHAVEARIYAEDPSRMFLPCPGVINHFHIDTHNPAVRLDTGIRSGDKVTAYYDPMIAKLICFGTDRKNAIESLNSSLQTCSLDGIKNNIEFLINTLNHTEFVAGRPFTGFIDTYKSHLI